mmetsp:Transcript_28322/g.70763  ORF Transcript_28322/g.70763 Transcript_28322/m.70763 type:complete len:285 (-) Transcript_28322:301-1155(-)
MRQTASIHPSRPMVWTQPMRQHITQNCTALSTHPHASQGPQRYTYSFCPACLDPLYTSSPSRQPLSHLSPEAWRTPDVHASARLAAALALDAGLGQGVKTLVLLVKGEVTNGCGHRLDGAQPAPVGEYHPPHGLGRPAGEGGEIELPVQPLDAVHGILQEVTQRHVGELGLEVRVAPPEVSRGLGVGRHLVKLPLGHLGCVDTHQATAEGQHLLTPTSNRLAPIPVGEDDLSVRVCRQDIVEVAHMVCRSQEPPLVLASVLPLQVLQEGLMECVALLRLGPTVV